MIDEGALYELSEGWVWAITSEVCSSVRDGTHDTPKYVEAGVPLITSKNLKESVIDFSTSRNISIDDHEKISRRSEVENGDVLFAMIGTIGNPVVVQTERIFSIKNVALFKKNESTIISQYLKLWLASSVFNTILVKNEFLKGTTQKFIPLGNLRILPIPLPPIFEQRAIVSKIEQLFSDLDNGIENFKKAQEQLKIYRHAVLKKAFEGEFTKKWREEQTDLPSAEELLQHVKEEQEKHYQKQLDKWEQAVKDWEDEGNEGKKPTKPKKPKELPLLTEDELMELSELPERWGYIKFGHIYSYSPQNGLYKPSDLYGSGTSIIRIDDFYDGKLIRYKNFKLVQLTKGEVEKYSLRKGQILVNRVNSIDYLGKCGLVEKIENNVVFESNIMKISILEKIVNPKFITYFLSSYLGTKEIRKNAKHAVNQASINQNDVSITNIPFCNIQEQHQIIKIIEARLSVCDNIEGNIEKSLQKAEALRQSILKKAFEGKLLNEKELEEARNALDWEPAEKLLERIKAEKTNTKAKNKGKK